MTDSDYLIEIMTIDLAKLVLQSGQADSIQSALDIVYNSPIYEKMCDERTHLMYQHPGYVFSCMNDCQG